MTADTADADAAALSDPEQDAAPTVRFGGLSPSEAAQKRWRDKRARDEDANQAAAHGARGEVALVRVTVETGAVIDKLAREAKNGNVQAARELREWLARVEQETDLSVSALDRATRQRMKARLLADIAADDQSDPSPLGAASAAHGSEGQRDDGAEPNG